MGTRVARIIIYAAMIAVVAGFGVVNSRDGRRLETIAAQIDERKREKRDIAVERVKQKETIAGAKKEMAALGDSVGAGVQMGMAMTRSQSSPARPIPRSRARWSSRRSRAAEVFG